jgi:hypothetical protein
MSYFHAVTSNPSRFVEIQPAIGVPYRKEKPFELLDPLSEFKV